MIDKNAPATDQIAACPIAGVADGDLRLWLEGCLTPLDDVALPAAGAMITGWSRIVIIIFGGCQRGS